MDRVAFMEEVLTVVVYFENKTLSILKIGRILVLVKYNRLTVSEAVTIDEHAGGYMEMSEKRNSARGHLIALKDKMP